MANADNNFLPYYGGISVNADTSERYWFAFMGEPAQLTEVHLKIQKDMLPIQHKIMEDWHPTKSIIDEIDVERLNKLAEERFVWSAGKWRISLNYAAGQKVRSAEANFTLTESDVKKMRSAFLYFRSGLGVFPNWRFMNASNQPSGIDLRLETSK